MLTITQIDYIRKLYFDKGLSITEIEKGNVTPFVYSPNLNY